MRLAEFIQHDMEAILQEWETFARTLFAAGGVTSLALRDHAPEIPAAVAKDLGTPQTAEAQAAKSKGRAPVVPGAPETAAQTHAVLRARGGFDIMQLVAEYRALRASVLRLWLADAPLDDTAVGDIIRFNEAIDQAVAESVGHFHGQVEQARNLLLGMLGHDMRNPLETIIATATYLTALNAGDEVSAAAGRLIRSGASMQALLDDLVDFNRTRLGLGINVERAPMDAATVLADELEQWRCTHPERRFELATSGDTHGRWDGPRLQQLVRNLLSNAIRYGHGHHPVRVALAGQASELRLEVANHGPDIDPAMVPRLFDPLRRGAPQERAHDRKSGLGLGLFIVHEIARAHGGRVEVRSRDGETVFTVTLPRHAP